MKTLLGVGLLFAACCGLPLLIMAAGALFSRKEKPGEVKAPAGSTGTESPMIACCRAPLALVKGAAALLSRKRRREVKLPETAGRPRY